MINNYEHLLKILFMQIEFVEGDITTIETDAIVNPIQPIINLKSI